MKQYYMQSVLHQSNTRETTEFKAAKYTHQRGKHTKQRTS